MMNIKRKGRRVQEEIVQKAKFGSTSEITSQYDAVQLNREGSCTVDEGRGSTDIRNVCKYILRAEGDLDRQTD